MVTDVQGFLLSDKTIILTDPAIHSKSFLYGDKTGTDLGMNGIKAFMATHKCNEHCDVIKKKLNLEF